MRVLELFAGEHDIDFSIAQGIDEGIRCAGIGDDDIDIGNGSEAHQVVVAQFAGITHDHDLVGIRDEGRFDGCFLGIGRRQAVIEGQGIGPDESDIGTHERHGAQGGIADDGLGDSAYGPAEELDIGNAAIG